MTTLFLLAVTAAWFSGVLFAIHYAGTQHRRGNGTTISCVMDGVQPKAYDRMGNRTPLRVIDNNAMRRLPDEIDHRPRHRAA